jgi:hypothetical protein
MKQTLREQIEKMLSDLIARQEMLDTHINQYVEAGNLMDAAINKIKMDTLDTVRIRLQDALS